MTDVRLVFEGSTLDVARALLGSRLVREDATGRRVGRIVEVEAYIGEDDQASHARFGRTARNAVMFGPPGVAYVYLVYGMHDCLNIVTEPAGHPAALLVRAVEPLEGIVRMGVSRAERSRSRRRPGSIDAATHRAERSLPAHRLASGPGLVCAAFDLDRSLTGHDLLDPSAAVRIEARPDGEPRPRIVSGARIGIAYAGEPWISRPWRLAIADHPSVSGPPVVPASVADDPPAAAADAGLSHADAGASHALGSGQKRGAASRG